MGFYRPRQLEDAAVLFFCFNVKKYTKCQIDGCTSPGQVTNGVEYFPKGYCVKHYQRFRAHGDPLIGSKVVKVSSCSVEGCTYPGRVEDGVEYFVKGFCRTHYWRFRAHGDHSTVLFVSKSGNAKHPLYYTWVQMKDRTSNPNTKGYHNYGGRGIKVCERWLGPYGFDNFIEDMGEKPTPEHTLDRKDNDGDYTKENCRWATSHQQAANRRSNNEMVGVRWCEQRNKWVAQIKVGGKMKNLGRFTNYEDAVAARKGAEKELGITY